jgi:hypothetical protein
LQVAFVGVFVMWVVGVVFKSWRLCVSVVFGWWFVGLVPFGCFLGFFRVWFWVGEIGVFCTCEVSWLDSM